MNSLDGWNSFWDRVSPEPNSGCLIWLGDISSNVPLLGGRSVRKRIWDRLGIAVPDGHAIRAKCGVQSCVNHSHFHSQQWGVINGENRKNFTCEESGCDRKAVVSCLCRVHYSRKKEGRENGSIRRVDPGRGCSVSGCEARHYGENFCRAHYGQIKAARLKRDFVDALGGKCFDCGGVFHINAMDFHHLDASKKEASVSTLIRYSRKRALSELEKCVVLCANCHRLRHSDRSIDEFLGD